MRIRVAVGALALLALMVNVWALRSGVRLGGDSTSYLAAAQDLQKGRPLEGNAGAYLGYLAILAVSQLTGAGLAWVVVLQVVATAVTGLALFSLGRRVAGRAAGLLSAGLVLANPDIVRWEAYILTDSLYISVLVLAVWALAGIARPLAATSVFTAALLCAAGALVRPTGWLLVPAYGVVVAGRLFPHRAARVAAVTGVVTVFVAAIAAVPELRGKFEYVKPDAGLRQGTVLWTPRARWQLSMPRDMGPQRDGLGGALSYAVRHPLATARLGITRIAAEVAHVRPYYSAAHNLLVAGCLLPMYVFAAYGLFVFRRARMVRIVAGVIVAHLVLVAATYADYDGRFLLYVLPLIGVLTACGVVEATNRLTATSREGPPAAA